MKHNYKVTIILLSLFLASQLIGLYIVNELNEKELAFGIDRPEFEQQTSFIPIFSVILLATIVALILIHFKAVRIWKFWFFISIVLILTISLSAFFNQFIALALAAIAAFFKIIKPNVIIHNISELFLYGGLAAIFVSSLNILSISVLLILIMIYDAYAVWKSKHMVKLAKFQSKLKLFTGLLIPYGKKSKKVAILGGGDMGFPLLFTGVAFIEYGLISLVIPILVTISLFSLLYLGDKNKFYPAMPFLGAGCFAGYFLILIFT